MLNILLTTEYLDTIQKAVHSLDKEHKVVKAIELRLSAEESLLEFTKQAWSIIEGPGRPLFVNWHMEALCEHLEALYYGTLGGKILLCNFPPRTMKTTLIAVMFPAWVWIRRPETQFMSIANNSRLVTQAATKSRDIIRSDWYQANWGDVYQIKVDEDAKLLFKNDKTGYRASFGLQSGITGSGGEFILLDDPNNTEESDVDRQNVNDIWDGTISTRQNSEKFGGIILMQQRTDMKDLTGHILDKEPENCVHLVLPMEFESARRAKTIPLPSTNGKPWQDPRTKEGELLWPEFRTAAWVERQKKRFGDQYRISGQFQQNPSPSEGGVIKKSWFPWWTEITKPEIVQTIQSWDTGLSDGENCAYSACTTYGIFKLEDNVYGLVLLGCWRGKLEYPDLRKMAVRLSRDYRDDGRRVVEQKKGYEPDIIMVEAKASGLSLVQDLRRAGIKATGFNPTRYGDKWLRVRIISHHLEAGMLYLPALPPNFTQLAPYAADFLHQMSIYPKDESRDIVDSMTQVLIRVTQTGWIKNPEDKKYQDDIHYESPVTDSLYGLRGRK